MITTSDTYPWSFETHTFVYPITVNQVMVVTMKLSTWLLQLNQ